jgi:Flp pilus assembly protein TadD
MTDKTSQLFNQVSATQNFLLAKTDAGPAGADPKDTRKGSDTVPEALGEAFPDLAMGRKFLEHAMGALETAETFCACAVRIAGEGDDPKSDDPSVILAVADAVDSACRQENGIWGMIDSDLFGCFFPEKTDAFGGAATELIRSFLPPENRPPVIIGTASFPSHSFPKDRILENACKAVDHACFFGPDSGVAFDDVSLNISGDKIFQRGDIPAAVAEYKKGLEINERNINLRNSLGVCHGLLGRLDQAKQEFAAAVCCDPRETMSLYNLGLIHMLLGDREKALEFFQKARKLDDEVFEVNYHIGQLLLEMGDGSAALPYLDRALELDASSAQAHRSYGDYHVSRDQLGDAVIAYKKAIKLNPNDAAALSALGAVYDMRDENTEIATLYCEKSVQLSPEEGLFYLRLGRLYLKEDRVDEARIAFKTAAELGQHTPEIVGEDPRSQKAC